MQLWIEVQGCKVGFIWNVRIFNPFTKLQRCFIVDDVMNKLSCSNNVNWSLCQRDIRRRRWLSGRPFSITSENKFSALLFKKNSYMLRSPAREKIKHLTTHDICFRKWKQVNTQIIRCSRNCCLLFSIKRLYDTLTQMY